MKPFNPSIEFRSVTLFLILLVLGCFGLLPTARALLPLPTPDGGYPGGNTAEGQSALFSLTTGTNNTAIGWLSLRTVTAGQLNTAIGAATLTVNTGDLNTATGGAALLSNTIGVDNTATGALALFHNIDGNNNTANGIEALFTNGAGHDNTACGDYALVSNIDGNYNTADGNAALFANEHGNQNTAIGRNALSNLVSGNDNVAVGSFAGVTLTLGSNNIDIENGGLASESNSIRIGNNSHTATFIGGIYSNVQPIVGIDPDSVTIASDGRLGRGNVSSRRYKHDIKPMDEASEVIFALKPVSFRYNKEYDATQTLAFGLIAEEVAQVNPDLVGRNYKGQPESVRYEQINAMLLNEFLKEHKKVEAQQATIAELRSTVAQQQKGMDILIAQLKEQAAQIQKVSARLEVSKVASRVVVNKP
jgi:hypothetical protein